MEKAEAARILVVDDDKLLRRIMAEGLAAEGASCSEAASGAEALKAAITLKPDICLLDQNLPDMDGLAVLAAMISRRELSAMRVYLLTGSEDEELASRAKSLGARGVLKKPCTPSDVMRVIREH
ncbi:MAG: response regulator [Acidobacteria bacterium]|nr:response regulator [Acidobacteriota bacterium]